MAAAGPGAVAEVEVQVELELELETEILLNMARDILCYILASFRAAQVQVRIGQRKRIP